MHEQEARPKSLANAQSAALLQTGARATLMTIPAPPSDPRVYFAAERTMLAWLRTGITIMAFGFVIARFGLFLRLIQAQGEGGLPAGHGLSPYVGSALVGLGVAATAGGAVEYQRFCRTIAPADLPGSSSFRFVQVLSWAMVLIGVVLTVMLLL
jgi:putative membrane protein